MCRFFSPSSSKSILRHADLPTGTPCCDRSNRMTERFARRSGTSATTALANSTLQGTVTRPSSARSLFSFDVLWRASHCGWPRAETAAATAYVLARTPTAQCASNTPARPTHGYQTHTVESILFNLKTMEWMESALNVGVHARLLLESAPWSVVHRTYPLASHLSPDLKISLS